MTIEGESSERGFLWRLTGACVCWILLAIANVGPTDQRLISTLIGVFSLACGICTGILAVRPATDFAYRYGGTLAVGTLTLRCFFLIEFEVVAGHEYLWFSLAQIGITAMLGFLYAWWWLTDVKVWHHAHRQVGR